MQARATQLQKDFGIEMGPGRQAQVKAYKVEVAAFGVAMEAIGGGLTWGATLARF